MSRDLTLVMKLQADASRMTAGLLNGERGVRKFSSVAKREFDSLKNSVTSVEGKLASLGISIGVTASIMQSAQLDREMKLLQLTAGGAADEAERLRKELFAGQKNYGAEVDELKAGVDTLIAGGQNLKQATATVEPMAQVLAVAKTNAVALAKGMGVASQQFNIDLTDTREATLLLDKMYVGGKAGYAELENLPDIFARVGANAKSAGLDVNKSIALIETLSLAEPNSERLGTLVDSTLRLFTRGNYLKKAQKETGIKFFDAKGDRRDAIDVVNDIKTKYDSLKTSSQRFRFVQKAFGESDAETIKGLQTLLDGNSLTKLNQILADVRGASGAVKRDVNDGLNNLPMQIKRASGALREAADGFARPINDAMGNVIKHALDKKEDGGMGMDGKDLLLAGGGAALVTMLTAKYGSKAISSIAGKVSGVGAGVATGKALETAAGVTPVYVVNMSEGGMGGSIPGIPGMGDKVTKTAGAASMLSKLSLGSAALGAAPLAAMYGFMSRLDDKKSDQWGIDWRVGLGNKLNKLFGHDPDKAQREWRARKDQELNGTLTVKVDSDGRVVGTSLKTNQPGMKINMANGPYMATQ